jgi:acetyl esterase/lipase
MYREYWQRLGLRIINGVAHSVPAVREQVAYGDLSRHYLDWYRLAGDPARRPVVLFFYGGNWRSGRRQDYRFVADTLLTLGCDVVVPDYRLYPHVRFADIIEDARAAAATVLARLSPDQHVILMGHSAGAQIGALLTLDRSLLPDARIAGFIGLAGPYDFYPFTEDDHWELFGPEAEYPASQPVNFVRADAAPLFLLHGADDRRVRPGHAKSLMLAQQAVGGRAERRLYPGMGHVDLVLAFSRLHRRRNPVVRDVRAIVESLARTAPRPAALA